LDEEDARLDMATHNLTEEIETAVGNSEVERQLEERKRRVLGNAGGAGGASSSGDQSSSSSN